jgi:hypothetical protein
MVDDDFGKLIESINQGLEHCLEQGMRRPFLVVAVGINGSIYGIRITPTDGTENKVETIAKSFERSGFALPVNIMVIDADGKAALVVLSKEGTLTFH